MTRHAAALDVSILARPPGMIAIAGSAVGTLLVVITLFVVLYAEGLPWWIAGWVGACGASLMLSGVWAWQRPHEVVGARQLGAVTAIGGLGSSIPAFRMWIELGLGDSMPPRLDVIAVGVALGLSCACYLVFVAADLERCARLAMLARGRR